MKRSLKLKKRQASKMTERELMLTSVLNCRRVDLYAQEPTLSLFQKELFNDMELRRKQGEPLQYIIGETEFCGLSFNVDKRVLIPRPETEIMVEKAAQYLQEHQSKELNILEIGTGSGCIAVSLAKKFPHLKCHAIDVSHEALCVAQQNIERHKLSDQIVTQCMDAEEFLTQSPSSVYDMIISNPPYISLLGMKELPEEVKREPHIALDGGDDGLMFYRTFIQHAPKLLKSGGILVCEFWDGQDSALKEIFGEKWAVEFFKDLSGVNRFFMAEKLLMECKCK